MNPERLDIRTRDGACPSYVFRPAGAGPWPAVLVFIDIVGIRPASLEVGARLATHGYYVLLPDIVYRSGPYEPMDAKVVLTDPDQRRRLMERFSAPATIANLMSDTQAFLDFLDAQPDVRRGGIGTSGYCRGGAAALAAAGTYPERILAAASFHGGRLATDDADSPHRAAPRIRGRIYVAGAIEDPTFPDDMKARLDRALSGAGVDYRLETYPARHGWVFRDTAVYDEAACERHWRALLDLLDSTLKPA